MMMTTPKKRQTQRIREAQRHTVALKLRLSPRAAEALRKGAEREETTMSDYVEQLLLDAIPDGG